MFRFHCSWGDREHKLKHKKSKILELALVIIACVETVFDGEMRAVMLAHELASLVKITLKCSKEKVPLVNF